MSMLIRKLLGRVYRWGMRLFIYNDINGKLFFPKGYTKLINGEKIKVPFKYSWVYPNIYEPEKTDFIRKHCKQGDVVIDIGAHMGVFSFFLAKQVGAAGKVFSFEPAPLTYSILSETIRFNHLESIVNARQEAVSDENKQLEFYIYNNSRISSGNSLSPRNPAGTPHAVKVNTITLDDFFKEKDLSAKVAFIKIDAEGAELEILKGGKETILRYKPYITLEVHPRVFMDKMTVMKEIFDTATSYGYRIESSEKIMPWDVFAAHNDCFEVVLVPDTNNS